MANCNTRQKNNTQGLKAIPNAKKDLINTPHKAKLILALWSYIFIFFIIFYIIRLASTNELGPNSNIGGDACIQYLNITPLNKESMFVINKIKSKNKTNQNDSYLEKPKNKVSSHPSISCQKTIKKSQKTHNLVDNINKIIKNQNPKELKQNKIKKENDKKISDFKIAFSTLTYRQNSSKKIPKIANTLYLNTALEVSEKLSHVQRNAQNTTEKRYTAVYGKTVFRPPKNGLSRAQLAFQTHVYTREVKGKFNLSNYQLQASFKPKNSAYTYTHHINPNTQKNGATCSSREQYKIALKNYFFIHLLKQPNNKTNSPPDSKHPQLSNNTTKTIRFVNINKKNNIINIITLTPFNIYAIYTNCSKQLLQLINSNQVKRYSIKNKIKKEIIINYYKLNKTDDNSSKHYHLTQVSYHSRQQGERFCKQRYHIYTLPPIPYKNRESRGRYIKNIKKTININPKLNIITLIDQEQPDMSMEQPTTPKDKGISINININININIYNNKTNAIKGKTSEKRKNREDKTTSEEVILIRGGTESEGSVPPTPQKKKNKPEKKPLSFSSTITSKYGTRWKLLLFFLFKYRHYHNNQKK